MTKKIIINEKLSDEKKKRLVALFGADRSEDEEEVQVKTTSPTAATTSAPKEQPKKTPVDKKPQVVAKPKLAPTGKPEIKPADKKDKTAAVEPERKPLEIPKPDWLPGRIDNAFRELALIDGKGTPFAQTGTEKELGDPTGQAGQAAATGAIEGSQELTAIAQLLNKANYPQPCYEYIEERFNSLDDFIIPATGVATLLVAQYGGPAAIKAIATTQFAKFGIKGMAQSLRGMTGKKKAIGALIASALAGLGVWKGAEAGEWLADLFKNINFQDEVMKLLGLDEDEVDPACVVIVNGVIAGTAALLAWIVTTRAVLAFFKRSTTAFVKLAPKLKDVFLRGFYSSIMRQAKQTQEIVLDIVRNAPVENKDILEQLPNPEATKALLEELPDLLMTGTKGKPLTSKEVQDLIYSTLDDANNPIQKELADRLINNVFNKLDPAYNTAKINAYKRAERSATRAAKQADDVARELRGQAGFGFDEVAELSGPGLNRTGRLINKAFDANNTTEAARLLDDVVQTARSRGFLKISPLMDKDKIIDLVAQARKANPDVSEIQVLNYVLDRVKTDAKNLRIDAEDWLKFTEKAGRETSKQVMDAEIKQTIKDRVEQTLRGITEDSPRLQEEALRQRAKEVYPNMTPDEAYKQILKDNGDEFEEAVEKTTEIVTEATEQAIEEAAKKKVFISKQNILAISTILLGALGGFSAVRLNREKETSSSPWFLDDNSNISFLNNVTGRESYVKLKDLVLKSDLGNRAKREFLDMVYNTNSPETKAFIDKMSNLKKNQIPVDTLIDFSKENLEDLAVAHKENIIQKLESLVEPEKLYGSSNPRVQSNKKESMFRIIAELFILNAGINNDLLDYLNKVVKDGDKFSAENRKRFLNKIFLGGRASMAAERRFRNKLNKVSNSTSPIFGTPRPKAASNATPGAKASTGLTKDDVIIIGDSNAVGLPINKERKIAKSGEQTGEVYNLVRNQIDNKIEKFKPKAAIIHMGYNGPRTALNGFKDTIKLLRSKGITDIRIIEPKVTGHPTDPNYKDKIDKLRGQVNNLSGVTIIKNNAENRSDKYHFTRDGYVELLDSALSGSAKSSAPLKPGSGPLPSKVPSQLGVDQSTWDIYRETLGKRESSNNYSLKGGAGGLYDGRYQIGSPARQDAADQTGDKTLTQMKREEFRSDPQAQEKALRGYTVKNLAYLNDTGRHRKLWNKLKQNQIEKMAILAVAHLVGHGGAKEFIANNLKSVNSDKFGTKDIQYYKLIKNALSSKVNVATQITKETKQMSKKDIKQLVAEVLNEGYSKYPYNANEYSEGEPDEDYMVEWKALVDQVCGSKVKNVDGDPKTIEDAAVEVAKLLVKDQDLFRDVLETAGANKSIGVEIMQQLKAAREKQLDKKNNV